VEVQQLTAQEQHSLLKIARQSLEHAVRGQPLPDIALESLSPRLQAQGASFVTLTIQGNLRGCIGALEPYQPLALDVSEHAAAAALHDYRFPKVEPDELANIRIEVSCLTLPVPLVYQNAQELLDQLRPGLHGVMLRDEGRRATFLPQVWEKIPDPADFLDNLCYKMGAAPDLWKRKPLEVSLYQVEEFHET
jgi:AmmeMemoRadiSam system protein A